MMEWCLGAKPEWKFQERLRSSFLHASLDLGVTERYIRGIQMALLREEAVKYNVDVSRVPLDPIEKELIHFPFYIQTIKKRIPHYHISLEGILLSPSIPF